MRFIIGLLLGLGIGLAAALLLAPEKDLRRRQEEPLGEEEPGAGEMGEDRDALAGLRRAMQGLQRQVQEAWEEARHASQEAEQEMADGGAMSVVGLGAAYEWLHFGSFAAGPTLQYRHRFSESLAAHTVALGMRLVYRSGP